MKTKPFPQKVPRRAARTEPEAKPPPEPEPPPHDIRAVLTARVDMLLEKNRTLEELVDRYERERKIMPVAEEAPKKIKPPVALGAWVFYTPMEVLNAPVAPALVIGSHDDGTVDLRVSLGYCQGTTDVKSVHVYDAGEDADVPRPRFGTYSKELPEEDEQE
jgi:hypothetical protein